MPREFSHVVNAQSNTRSMFWLVFLINFFGELRRKVTVGK